MAGGGVVIAQCRRPGGIHGVPRLEECLDNCLACVQHAVCCSLQGEYILASVGVETLLPRIETLTQCFESEQKIDTKLILSAFSELKVECEDLVYLRDSKPQLLSDAVAQATDLLESPVGKRLCITHPLRLQAMREKLAAVAARMPLWQTLLTGIQAVVEVTVDHGKISYEPALVAWQAWQKERIQPNVSAPVQDRPYLAAVLGLCETRAASRDSKFPPYPLARCPGGSLTAVETVVNFLSSSVVGAVYNEHCLGKVLEALEAFFTRVQMGTAILAGSEQLEKSSPEALVGMITRAPVADLHAHADQHCDFSDPRLPVTSKMPHSIEVRMVSTLALKIMEEPLFVAGLQKAASAPIAKEDIVLLLAMHTNGWAVTNLVATAHMRLFAEGSLTNKQGGLDVTVIGALVGLRRARQKMVDSLKGDKYAHIDEHGYGLNQSVELVVQWLRCVDTVTDAYASCYMTKALKLLKGTATDLVNALPRWEGHITETVLNVDMAIESVLEHPKKSQLLTMAAKVRQMLTVVVTAAELLQPNDPSLDKRTGPFSGIMNHAEAACRSSDTANLIASALTAVLQYGRKQGGQNMSKEVLAVEEKDDYKGAKIPSSLRRLLEGVRDGDMGVLDGYDPYKPKASHSKSGGKQSKKRKRDHRSDDEASCEKSSRAEGGVSPGAGVKAELNDSGAVVEGEVGSAPASPCGASMPSAPLELRQEASSIDVDMDGF